MDAPEKRVLTAQQYAEVRGITMDELYNLIRTNRVAYYKPSRKYFFLWPSEEV